MVRLSPRAVGLSLYRAGARLFAGRGLERYPLIVGVNNRVIARLKPNVHRVHGHQLRLDSSDSLRLSVLGVHEPLLTSLIEQEVGPGSTAIDIGAHIGYFSLLLAKAVTDTGRVIAFEPESQNAALLRTNIKINGYANIEVIEKAVADTAGSHSLHVSPYNRGAHTMFYSTKYVCSHVQVETVQLDIILAGQSIDFIKMDVEGAEGLVLRGAQELLRENDDLIVAMEVFPYRMDVSGVSVEECLQLLHSTGFRVYAVREDIASIKKVVSVRDIFKDGTRKRLRNGNIICVKGRLATFEASVS